MAAVRFDMLCGELHGFNITVENGQTNSRFFSHSLSDSGSNCGN